MKGRKESELKPVCEKMKFFQGSPVLSLTLSMSLASAQSLLYPPNSSLLWKIPPFLNCSTFCPPACSLLNGATGCQCLHLLLIDLVLTLKFLHPSSFYGQREAVQYPCSSALGVTAIHRVPSMNAEHMPGTHPIHTASSKECGHL